MVQEELILRRCAEILGVDRLQLHEDFFGVGGDSLDAVEISEMLSEAAGQDVPVSLVMESRTFEEMLRSLPGAR